MSWWETHITQGYKWTWKNTKGHSGIDLAESNGTPLTSAVSGQVISASAHDWGGQVSVKFTVNGQYYTLSYLHMSSIADGIQPGMDIRAGTYLGKSGGATWSRPYPTSSKYSSGPHLHWELWIGEKAPYVNQSPWRPDDGHHPLDPTGMFYALKNNGIPDDQSAWGFLPGADSSGEPDSGGEGPAQPGGGQRAHAILQEAPGFYGIVRAMDTAEAFNPWQPPKTSVAPTVGDLDISIGPFTEHLHIPGVSDLANAAAQARSAQSTAAYTMGWLVNNIVPLLVRLFLILLGLLLVGALLYAQVRRSEIVQTLAPNPREALTTALSATGGPAGVAAGAAAKAGRAGRAA